MLLQLDIRNFALIEHTSLAPGAGLTVFTGETGAGKSIVFDALGLLLGARASADMIRAGCDEATVSAMLLPRGPAAHAVAALLDDAGIRGGDELVLRRTIARTGPNRCWINDQPVTVSLLGAVTGELVELVGQHEHLALTRPGAQRTLLDRFGGHAAEIEQMRTRWRALSAAAEQLDALRAAGKDRAERTAMLRFQATELDALAARAGEFEELERQLVRARNAGKLRESAAAMLDALSEGPHAATGQLRRASEALHRALRLDDALSSFASRMDELVVLADDLALDLARQFRDLDEAIDLDRLEARHEQLRRAMRRFGLGADELPGRAQQIHAELALLDDLDARIESAERACARARADAVAAAQLLATARGHAAARLFGAVGGLLAELGMPHARMELAPQTEDESRLGPNGFDGIEFLFSANPGQPPAAMRRIASGGELSRILLAVKLALADSDPVATYVFDEVDTGIGGAAARVVGRMLRRLGSERQVLCVTHLAQIAAPASAHCVVEKVVVAGRTTSTVQLLTSDARVAELARMLGGDSSSATSLAHARELLAESQG